MYQPRMEAYEGSEPYIFISYAHRDADKVWPILDKLNDSGYRIWYDDGIDAGSEWPAYIEDHLNRCAAVISFITPRSVNSSNCRKEITYALAKQKSFVYVMLEETELAQGMSLQLSDQYCVNRGSMPEEKFLNKLCSSGALEACRRDGAAAALKEQCAPESAAKKPQPLFLALAAVALIAVAAVLILRPGTKASIAETSAPTEAASELLGAELSESETLAPDSEMSPNKMLELGKSYEFGQGVEQDYGKALEWYTKAAEAGDSYAMFHVGYMYDMGYGTETNSEKAFEWYFRSAEAGNPNGMFSVGQDYYLGFGGVDQNYSEAFTWFMRAADNGDPNSLYYIGMMYRLGQSVQQDSEKAIQWFMRSAEYGFSISMRAIGEMYAKGEGVEQDRDRADEWYARAAAADRSGQ